MLTLSLHKVNKKSEVILKGNILSQIDLMDIDENMLRLI